MNLSASSLNLFLECPRCFWLEKVRYIKRPRGIYPSLPNGMDRVIKTYFDTYRAKKTLPPELQGKDFEGVQLFSDQLKLDRWRNWKIGLECRNHNGSCLIGALDDLLKKDEGYIPFDYKTKGSPASEQSAIRYYQFQLDCYALLLEANGMPTIGHGFLLFYSPKSVGEYGQVVFEHQAIKIPTNTERAQDVLRRAVAFVKEPIPELNAACEYCTWFDKQSRNKDIPASTA
jgi:hypothetical protein